MGNVPNLRFPEFSGEWEKHHLASIIFLDQRPIKKPEKSYTRLRVRSHGKGTFYEQVDKPGSVDMDTLYEVKQNQLLVNITFAWEHAITVTSREDEGKLVSHRFPTYSFQQGNYPGFYKHYILRPKFKYQLKVASPGGAGRNRVLNKKEFVNIAICKPNLPEQTKIANLLSLFDKKIEKQSKKVAALEEYKKGLMQKIFSRVIRFKDDEGKDYPEWEKETLSNVLSERKSYAEINSGYKHVTLSTTGIYEKGERYNRDFLVTAKNKQYKITKLGDICYNPANLKFGVICFNNYGDAIFSPIYVTFEVKQLVSANYIGYYLMRWDFINRVRKYEQGTVYERMAVGPEDLLKHEFSLPPLPEQTKIANFLSLFDRKVEKEKEKLRALQEQKKGLLQQMFV